MALRGNIDQADRQGVRGWIRDETTPDIPISLLVSVDHAPPTRVLANAYRPDLEAAGIGNGRHGYALMLDGLSPLVPHIISVSREDDGTPLPGSPVAIQASAEFNLELRDYLAAMFADVDNDAGLTERAAFLAHQADRLLQLRADRNSGGADRAAQQQFRSRWSGREAVAPPSRGPRALVIDDGLPQFNRDAGSQALISHMKSLQRLGYRVTIAPASMNGGEAVAALEQDDIACCCGPWTASIEEVLRREAGGFGVVYIHRGANVRYLPLIRHYMPRARVIYSVADLHHLRLARQAEVEQRPELREVSQRVRTAELSAVQYVDGVITHSSFEAALLRRDLPNARVHVVPWAIPPQPTQIPFASRKGVAFIGSFGHAPNLDAAWWLIQDVMPLVRAKDPAIECLLIGSGMPEGLRAAAADGIRPLGFVDNLAEVFDQVRLTVAPLTFGAGVKGKVLDSMAAGVPCACTPIAAEGIDMPGILHEAMIADGADALATIIHRLHTDEALNAACAKAGLAYVTENLSEPRIDTLMREVLRLRAA